LKSECVARRDVLRLAAGAIGASLAMPRPGAGQSRSDREHRIHLDVPILAEEPAAVPLRVALDHPMEPDHYIRSIEVSIERDPVPLKGKFAFTPANGRPWVAYQMRSGTGGLVKVVAVCSREGDVLASRELRVVEGGCSTPPERNARDRTGHPQLRLPSSVRPGVPFEVRAQLSHASDTGLALRQGRFVRERPEYYVKSMTVWLDDQQVSQFEMTSAVSPHPLIRFPLRVTRPARLRVQFTNSEDQRWEVTEAIRI
jgi:sulfur-oxidizing protein SoxY